MEVLARLMASASDSARLALDRLNFEFRRGELLALRRPHRFAPPDAR
jgi:hypothetical protein